MTTKVTGRISDSLLARVREAGGEGSEARTIAAAVGKSIGFGKPTFDREAMTVTIELDDDLFVSRAIEKGLGA
jgi:hypothetical protein